MELRHLRYYVAVAEELNVRQAATGLHLSQPSVSGQPLFQSRDSNQHEANAFGIEDRAHLLETSHFQPIGFVHQNKLRGIADTLLLSGILPGDRGICRFELWHRFRQPIVRREHFLSMPVIPNINLFKFLLHAAEALWLKTAIGSAIGRYRGQSVWECLPPAPYKIWS